MFILLVPYLVNPAVQLKSMRRSPFQYEPTESGSSSDTSSDDESQRMLTLSWLVILKKTSITM